MPKISVIIPIYNVEKYLERCLDSVLRQTFTDFEVICVNDGSPDNSLTILEAYKEKDKRIKIINQENQGLSMARNNGLRDAVGEYIYFLDSDDSIHPQLLEITIFLAKKYQSDVVSFDFKDGYDEKIDDKFFDIDSLKVKVTDNPVLLVMREYDRSIFSKNDEYRVGFSVLTKLYKRNILEGIEFIPKIHFEDYPHTFAILAKKPKTVLIKEKLYFRTINPDSISRQKGHPKQIKDYHIGIDYIYHIYNHFNLEKELNFLRRNFIPTILRHQLRRCRMADKDMQPLMYQAFSEELRDLDKKGLLSWIGHKITRYFKYKRLMKAN